MIQFEASDIIQLGIFIFLAGVFYAATQSKIRGVIKDNFSLTEKLQSLGGEMKELHSEQKTEIQRIERDNHEIQTNVAVMVEGQKGMKEILLRMEISLKEHIDKES